MWGRGQVGAFLLATGWQSRARSSRRGGGEVGGGEGRQVVMAGRMRRPAASTRAEEASALASRPQPPQEVTVWEDWGEER